MLAVFAAVVVVVAREAGHRALRALAARAVPAEQKVRLVPRARAEHREMAVPQELHRTREVLWVATLE